VFQVFIEREEGKIDVGDVIAAVVSGIPSRTGSGRKK
jgi:hypothetical protein